jgi:hypothetical protein
MPSLPPRWRDSARQSVCAESCRLRPKPKGSTSRAAITRPHHVRFRYSLVTRNHPLDGFVGRLQSLGLPPPCYPSYGAPTFTPVGLTPTGCASLLLDAQVCTAFNSHYGLHTRWVTQCDPFHRRLQPFRYLHDCSDYFRLEHLPGGIRTHWKAPPFHGAHPKAVGAFHLTTGSDRPRPVVRRPQEQPFNGAKGSLRSSGTRTLTPCEGAA